MVALGIAGTGGMAEYHVKKFRALEGVTISACKDRNWDHAEAFSQRFEIPRFLPPSPICWRPRFVPPFPARLSIATIGICAKRFWNTGSRYFAKSL